MNNIPDLSVDYLMETDRLRLRAVTVDDAELMLAVWNDPAFIRNVTDRGIRTAEQAREAIESGAVQRSPSGLSLVLLLITADDPKRENVERQRDCKKRQT